MSTVHGSRFEPDHFINFPSTPDFTSDDDLASCPLPATLKCDVAVIGTGPVGSMFAYVLHLLNRDLNIGMFEKRKEVTRLHVLRIQSDSINTLMDILQTAPDSSEKAEFSTLLTSWREHSIPTDQIQNDLIKRVTLAGIRVFQGKDFEFKADELQDFINTTQARVIIGADGARSQVREAIGATQVDDFTLGYLLELKYQTSSEYTGRGKLEKSLQHTVAEGFDFETVGRPHEDGASNCFRTISLHKFIDEETYHSLQPMNDQQEVMGTQENPWTMHTLQQMENKDENVDRVIAHFNRYFGEPSSLNASISESSIGEPRLYSKERIVTFPMRVYRSSSVAERCGESFVLLAGDASSGMVLERGVNKGFIEAGRCAQAVARFFTTHPQHNLEDSSSNPSLLSEKAVEAHQVDKKTPDVAEQTDLPEEFQEYQHLATEIFYSESRWARWKFYALSAGEWLLSCVVTPFKWVIEGLYSLYKYFSSSDESLTAEDQEV